MIMKKTISIMLLFTLLTAPVLGCLSACADGGAVQGESTDSTYAEPSATVTLPDGTRALVAKGFRLDFKKTDAGYGVYVVDGETEKETAFCNPTPAMITVRDETRGPGLFNEANYAEPYSSVAEADGGYCATATLKTENGSEFRFEDSYYVTEAGTFAVNRKVTVVNAAKEDPGFRSVFSFADANGTKTAKGHDLFIPSILYKDSKDMVSGAIGSDLNVDRVYVKETRTGLPLAMLRSSKDKYSVAIAHLNPEITVGGNIGGGSHGDVNGELQYGSIGYKIREGLSVDFCYPSLECPRVYYTNRNVNGIFHPVTSGFEQKYSLSIIPAKADTYADAMTETFMHAYMAESPEIAEGIDMEDIYEYNIDVFARTFRDYGTGDVIAAGVPWSIDLSRGTVVEYTFQMGFVGQQTSVGYNLLRYGYANNSEDHISKGNAIIDFWTSDTIMKGALPIVWWDPRNNETAGQSRGYPSFLRCFVDGMEGILDAYKIAAANGEDREKWLAALVKTADFLAENQNDDGSYYRAYFTNGKVCTDTSDNRYQGTSKLNTPVAIRFLAKMYELTGEEKYKTAAVNAAEYSYNELYLELEKYIGGTPDNANTVDKEAAIYAMYGFNAAYALTGEEKYLKAAEHAAVSAMSWVYCYDFACPGKEDTNRINPFTDGGTSGFSIIATGHSGADNYSAFMYYEMFKLYVFTGKSFYLEAAKLLQINTKLSTDYDGKMGWKYRAIGPEATNVSDFNFGTVGVWLPWSGIANIKPIGYMQDTFGTADINSLGSDVQELRSMLDNYGIGGRLR